jgi:hypothetical protein
MFINLYFKTILSLTDYRVQVSAAVVLHPSTGSKKGNTVLKLANLEPQRYLLIA